MIKRISIILLFNLCFTAAVFGQLDRLSQIRSQLDTLSKNELKGLNDKVNFDLAGASLQEVLRSLAKSHQLNINIGNISNVTVSNSFNGVVAKDLIYFLCDEYELEVKFVNTIMSFSQVIKEPVKVVRKPKIIEIRQNNNLITTSLQNDSIYSFAKQFTQSTNTNLLVGPGLEDQLINGYVQNLPIDQALEQIAFVNNLKLKKESEGIFRLIKKEESLPVVANNNQQPARNRQSQNNRNTRNTNQRGGANSSIGNTIRRPNATGNFKLDIIDVAQKTFRLDADGADVSALVVAVSDKLGVDYVMVTPPAGYFDGFLGNIDYDSFLELILSTANSGFAIKKGVIMIGAKDDVNTTVFDIYKFENRSIDSLSVLIPETLSSQVTLQPYNGLNGVIVSGDEIAVKRTVEFFEMIDQPIPNILIEVIVADIRKGYTISTGISAGLSDSTVRTQGTVFPGLDLTLSSNSVNQFLGNLDRKGVINLGRVTPQFFATIQALEDNNVLNTRSTPQLSTLNGQKATLTIGERVYFLLETQNVTPGVNPIITRTPQFEEAEANLQIDLQPFVSGNEDITLEINAEFSTFTDPLVTGGPPCTTTRQFQSKIRVKNEEMIVLGGLEETRKSENASGVPLLSRIPVLKWLFSAKTKNKSESKLVVFIKPTVIY